MKQYYYLAFIPTEDGGYAIFSPDFTEIASQGASVAECIEMGDDALSIVVDEYARLKKPLPVPSDLATTKQRIAALLEEMDVTPKGDVQYQLFPAHQTDTVPVRISATFTRKTLDLIDRKAKQLGMSRSGFLATSAMAFEG